MGIHTPGGYDDDKQKEKTQHLSFETARRDESVWDLDGDDGEHDDNNEGSCGGVDEEKALASAAAMPPSLHRTTGARTTIHVQPGAFRSSATGGTTAVLATKNDDAEEDINDRDAIRESFSRSMASDSSSTLHHSHHHSRSGYHETVVEATLVTESEHTAAAEDSSTAPDIPPLYRAEPMEEPVKGAMFIRRTWIGWMVVAAVVLLGVTVVAVVVAVRVGIQGKTTVDSNANDEKTDTGFPPPTTSPPVNLLSPRERLAPFDRITHHVAFLYFATPVLTCNRLHQDIFGGNTFTVAVTVTCGNAVERRQLRSLQHETVQSDDVAALVVHDMSYCKQMAPDKVRCLFDYRNNSQSLFFTCGTHRALYNEKDMINSTSYAKTTATVRLEDTVSVCNDDTTDDLVYVYNNSNTTKNILDSPVVSAFLAMGRWCPSSSSKSNRTVTPFRSTASECVESSSNATNDNNNNNTAAVNVTYCVQQEKPCTQSNCVVNLGRFWIMDNVVGGENDCNNNSSSISTVNEDSWWYDEGSTATAANKSAMTRMETEMDTILSQQQAFIQTLLWNDSSLV